jgi:hypothetical protein
MKFLILIIVYLIKISALKEVLLKIKFNCNNICESFVIKNMDFDKSYLHNIQVKSLLHKNINKYEKPINYDKNIKGIPLLANKSKSPNKRLLNPNLIINREKEYFKKIFHKHIKYDKDNLMEIAVILPSFVYMPIKMDVKYSIYYPFKMIYSKDYCLDYSMWEINNFICLKFWN